MTSGHSEVGQIFGSNSMFPDAPNGISPGVPLIPREPDCPAHCHCCSEVECLADGAGPPPTHERRWLRAEECEAVDHEDGGSHCASVGVMEIKEKQAENVRKSAYYEALLAAENKHLHNEPTDVREAKERLDWLNWKAAMQEELDSLKQHGTYKQVKELPLGRKAVGYKWVFKLKLNPDNLIA